MDIILQSDADKMKDAVKTFTDTTKDLAERVEALEDLQALVETIDNANGVFSERSPSPELFLVLIHRSSLDLPKIGALAPVIQMLEDPNPEIQTVAAWVLGTCCQNNKESQDKLIEQGALKALVHVLAHTKSANTRGKALNAISGLVRANPHAMDQFRLLDGFATLLKVLDTDDEQSKRRLVHILTQLAASFPFVKDLVRETGLFQAIVDMIKTDDLDLREKCLAALIMFVDGSPQNKTEFKKRKVHLQLQQIQQSIANNEDNSEIHHLLTQLLAKLN